MYTAKVVGHFLLVRVSSDDISVQEARFVLTEDVEENEDLHFNYNTTEWDMSAPFECQCPACLEKEKMANRNNDDTSVGRMVRGFKYLPVDEKIELLKTGMVSPYIKKKCFEESVELIRELYPDT